ncbi:MAG: sigma-54 interaction domain-containing protein [Thermoanaerobaculia bacterium]
MAVACDSDTSAAAMVAVSAVFDSIRRALICLDGDLRILHVSPTVERVAGVPASSLVGREISELLGEELFGAAGTLRECIERGEVREGWRATMHTGDGGSRTVSITAAPFLADAMGICDQRVKFIIVLRPTEEDPLAGTTAPTDFFGMIARSTSMARIFSLVQNLQASDATVLLTGESGTGKEVLARAVHANSPRRHGRFLAVNCAALPGDLLEAELFGHVRGSFTGAVRDRVGRFEMAAGGTLFLDEIGDMPLHLQAKLLRVLQERTFERVGESTSRSTDARIIAATNIDLRRAIAEGRFREDLYYRLRVVPMEIPPLRSRREDIEPLAHFLLSRVAGRHNREVRFSPDALRALLRYTWPGNVRELENAIEYSVAVVRGQTIHAEDLPLEITQPVMAAAPVHADGEADSLRAMLDANQWNREVTARALGISRTTLWRKMREMGLVSS